MADGNQGVPNPVLASEVQRIFQKRGWRSTEQAATYTSMPESTIRRMRKGIKVDPESAIKFGTAVGEPREYWAAIALGLAPESIGRTDELRSSGGPLGEYGVEIDPRPYTEALRQVGAASAGADWGRQPFLDTPGDDKSFGPIRVFRVVGSCMEPVLHDGDEIILTAPDSVRDGDIVTATVDISEVTCKRICIPGDGRPSYLEPINGEAIIMEGRFVVTGVVQRVIESVDARLRRERERIGSSQ